MKKIISIIISLSLLIGTVNISFAKATFDWEDRQSRFKPGGQEWSFRPPANYLSEQNPPDFSWPRVAEASSYELIVARDEEMKDIAYENKDLKTHFYNFPHVFEVGIYYWSVRFKSASGYSSWTTPSRFIITPDAHPFVVDDAETMISKLPLAHPRIAVNPEKLTEYRELSKSGGGKEYFDEMYVQAKASLKTPIPTEKSFDLSKPDSLRSASLGAMNMIMKCAIVYLIAQDKEIGEFGVKILMEMASWDPNGVTAYEVQDQCFRDILDGLAFGYDYLYDLLTSEQRAKVLSVIRERAITLEHPTKGLTDAIYQIDDSPYMSHGWTALGYLMNVSFATYGEIPEAEIWLKKYLPMYLNVMPPWGNEDGGWSQGTGYGAVSVPTEEDMRFTMYVHGMANIYDKAYYQNLFKYMLYTTGPTTGAEFGDQSTGKYDNQWAMVCRVISHMNNSGYGQWQLEKFGISPVRLYSNYYITQNPKTEAKAPIDLPRSTHFKDIGWVSMHSDLTDLSGRISMQFKSSQFGSYNHSHNDQNSFTISAYGERLSIDSGYYDGYFYDFYNKYYKKTYAHNAITFDGGIGQAPNAKASNGDVTNYLTHPSFDLVSGEAKNAYNLDYDEIMGSVEPNEKTKTMKRHVVYVRPDTFLVIDDLKKANGEKSSFEWWLNAYDNISLYKSKTGARIEQGKAALDAQIHYPEKIKAGYSDMFSGPDLVPNTPTGGYENEQVHKRVWFSTEPVEQTKIVSTMSVHKKEDPAQYVKSEIIGNINKLQFENGVIAYVALNDDVIEIDTFKTDAAAIIKDKNNYMIVDGTNFSIGDKEIFKSNKKVSLTIGEGELGVSSYEDSEIEVNIGEVTSISNEKGTVINKNEPAYGVSWDNTPNGVKLKAYKGFYTFYLNGKSLPGTKAESKTLKYSLNGEEKDVPMQGYINHDGDKILSGGIGNTTDFYVIEDLNDVNVKGNSKAGELVLLSSDETVFAIGDNPYLKLKSFAQSGDTPVEKIDNPEEYKKKLTVLAEAESFTQKVGSGRTYSGRDFLSGKVGVTDFNTFGESMTWNVDVPEDGQYDVVFKYVGWAGTDGTIQRLFKINNDVVSAKLPETGNYGQRESEWIGAKVNCKLNLKKGVNELTVYPKIGSWNFDWVGLVKSN